MRKIKQIILLFFLLLAISNSFTIAGQSDSTNNFPPFFSINAELKGSLEKGLIPDAMRQKFTDMNILFSKDTRVLTRTPDIEWVIFDKGDRSAYTIIRDNDKLDIYGSRRNYGNKSTLKLEIQSERQFVAYEPVLFTVKMANISKDDVVDIFLPIHIAGRCIVFDPDGNVIPLNHRAEGIFLASTTSSESGEIFSQTFNLLDYFDMGKQEGLYTVEYRYPLPQMQDDGKGKIRLVESDALTAKLNIEIVNAMDGLERDALNIFRPAIERQLRGEAIDTVAEDYKRVLKDYPTSRYAEYALFYLAQYYDDAWMIDEADQTYEEFIRKYPKSFFTDIAKYNQKEARERAIRDQETLMEIKKAREERSKTEGKPENPK